MYLYLLENEKNKLYYIGITNCLERRLLEHNKQGKHFTNKMHSKWKLIGFKLFSDEKAHKEEIRLKKSKNKNYIKWYFENKIP